MSALNPKEYQQKQLPFYTMPHALLYKTAGSNLYAKTLHIDRVQIQVFLTSLSSWYPPYQTIFRAARSAKLS